jgi:hypothetical protein
MEKISFFKRTGRIYGEADLERIMTVINRRNMVFIEDTPKYQSEEIIISLIEQFDAKSSTTSYAQKRKFQLKISKVLRRNYTLLAVSGISSVLELILT